MSLIKVDNIGDTYVITLSERATHILERWSREHQKSKTEIMDDIITDLFKNKIEEYSRTDGPRMAQKYADLTDDDKAAIDAILAKSEGKADV